ncbi:unnamed protein product [Clonostachys solani]|uniref:Uncharacterized protein n=1 Tax=Clonostachys solani TaxID=160281 RepID=A0A9N9VTX0_9HYPO|nr:unnamed protein product [Clonostachys solani]
MANGPDEGFYSPGLRCPDGHTTAVSTTFGGEGNWQPIYSLVEGLKHRESKLTRLDSSFLFQNDGTSQSCIFTQTSTYYNQVDCYSVFSGNNWYEIPRTITNRGHGAGPVPYAAHVVVRAPIYQLNFQSSDLPSTNSATDTTTASTSDSTADKAAETSANSSASGASQSLSTGAQAGIGVSAGLAGFALIGAIIFFLLKRRRREQEKIGEPTQWDESKTETSDPTLVGSPPMSELHDQAKFELHGQAKIELHDQAKVEIGGEQRYEIQGQQKFELPA